MSYWEALLDSLRPYMAKQRLKEFHAKILQIRLQKIRKEQMAQLNEAKKIEDKAEEITIAEKEEPTTSANMEIITAVEDEEEKEMEEMDVEELERDQQPVMFSIEQLLEMEDEQRDQSYQ